MGNIVSNISGITLAFVKGWQLTLFDMALLIPWVVLYFMYVFYLEKGKKDEQTMIEETGVRIEETFSFIKTVKAMNGEESEINNFASKLEQSKNTGIRNGLILSIIWAAISSYISIFYAIMPLIAKYMIANKWINNNSGRIYTVGDLMTITGASSEGLLYLTQIGPTFKEIGAGIAALDSILKILENDSDEISGSLIPETIHGEIEFKNVTFSYPQNKSVTISNNLSFKIHGGQKAAFVGASGCGKSSVFALLQRFYDPDSGVIFLDGIDIREYNLQFLRGVFGMVFQQPVLFAESIRYNLTLGLEKDNVLEEDMWEALQLAEAKEFVSFLPNKFNQYVGSSGNMLSGGQKQRVAIARCILRKPKIYLFDEATSALDSANEKEIQKTIDRVSSGYTSITIAHRLSTIRNSDMIYCFQNGSIIEQGSHETLQKNLNGLYKKLLSLSEEDPIETEIDVNMIPQYIRKLSKRESYDQNFSRGTLDIQHAIEAIEQNNENTKKIQQTNKSIFEYLGNEKRLIPLSFVLSIICGTHLPVVGFLFGQLLNYMVLFECFLPRN